LIFVFLILQAEQRWQRTGDRKALFIHGKSESEFNEGTDIL